MEEQRADGVILVIDGLLNEFVSADENDRFFKISTFMTLSDFQMQLIYDAILCERIDSEFADVMSHIVEWFYNDYSNMIDEIAETAAEDVDELLQYFSDFSDEIDRLCEVLIHDDDDEDDEMVDEREHKAELFAELNEMRDMLMDDDFIQQRAEANEEHIQELIDIKTLIDDESIIDRESTTVLYDTINSVIEVFLNSEHTAYNEAENILNKIETELSLLTIWFEEHYLQLIDEIEEMEREDEYDDATVVSQIEKLKLVIQYIEEDGVAGDDLILSMNEQIEQLIEDYESELALIVDRINLKKIEEALAAAAAAATAAAANNRNTGSASSSNNNRTGSSNNSSNNTGSGSSGSGSSNSSGSGSGSGSSGGSTGSHNNNYPSISSSCRDLLARLVKLEAPNESADGKQAVAEVVLNRMVSSRWSHANTVEEVIFDDKWGVQFTVRDIIWTDRGNPSSSDTAAVDRALSGSNVLSRSYVFFNTRPVTQVDVIWIGRHAFSK